MPRVELPKNEQRRRELYCLMLGVSIDENVTMEELERICLERGYLVRGDD